MIFVALAWAAPVGGSEGTPLPGTTSMHVLGELRAGHAISQRSATAPIGSAPRFSPNAHLSGSLVLGGRHGGLLLGLHGAVERARTDVEANTATRIEPRFGARVLAPFRRTRGTAGFLEGGLGGSVAFVGGASPGTWSSPCVFGALGWIGPGASVRPVLAVEGRVGLVIESFVLCPVGVACISRRHDPAGTGVLGSAGVVFGSARAR